MTPPEALFDISILITHSTVVSEVLVECDHDLFTFVCNQLLSVPVGAVPLISVALT